MPSREAITPSVRRPRASKALSRSCTPRRPTPRCRRSGESTGTIARAHLPRKSASSALDKASACVASCSRPSRDISCSASGIGRQKIPGASTTDHDPQRTIPDEIRQAARHRMAQSRYVERAGEQTAERHQRLEFTHAFEVLPRLRVRRHHPGLPLRSFPVLVKDPHGAQHDEGRDEIEVVARLDLACGVEDVAQAAAGRGRVPPR